MTLAECLRDSNVDEALRLAKSQVKDKPADTAPRILLFQLFSLNGEWERAANQLDVLASQDPELLPMVQTYQDVIQCEAFREEVFSGKRTPLLFGEPQEWLARLIEALRLTATGDHENAQAQRAEAFDNAPATHGAIDGQEFEWIADADERLGPVLEVILNGRYFWVPYFRIKEIELEAPEDVRDLVWIPAHFTWANGGKSVGFIPSRYPNSQRVADGRIRMARATQWEEIAPDAYVGLGQRMLATPDGEYALLETRSITLQSDVGPASADAGELKESS